MSPIERQGRRGYAAKRKGYVRAVINKRKGRALGGGDGKEIGMSIDVAAAETNEKIRYAIYRYVYSNGVNIKRYIGIITEAVASALRPNGPKD